MILCPKIFKMKRILLIQQYLGDNVETGPVFPIGLAYIATAIKKLNWDIKVLDMNIYDNPYMVLDQILPEFNPDVIGVSLRNIDNVDYDHFRYYYDDFCYLMKHLSHSQSTIIVGGAGFSIFAKEIMAQNKAIDYGILHEGEETFVELLSAIANGTNTSNIKGICYRKGDSIVSTEQRPPLDFSKSDIPDRSYFNMSSYDKPLCIGVQTKRGCSLKCSYCTYPFLSFHIERFRSAKSVVDEIQSLVENYDISEIIFCDDIFNVPRDHSIRIIQELNNRKISIRWSAWFDIANTDEELIDLAIESGCYRFCFSVEGAINPSLKALGKNFNTKQISDLLKIVEKPKYKNLDFRFSIFAVPPKQTLFGILKTINFVYRTHVKRANIKCLVSWIRVYPYTPIYESMNSKPQDLLPSPAKIFDKSSLFWGEHNFNVFTITIFHSIIKFLNYVRKFKRKHFWK